MTDIEYSQALELLHAYLGSNDGEFYQDQWESIDALVNSKEKLLLIQRTGWGKSVVYFIATALLRKQGFGLTLIISPLLSLMRDQLKAAERIGLRAISINSTNKDEWTTMRENLYKNTIDILLISPERFANEEFNNNDLPIISGNVGMLVIDEAHCISDWGHDFRPDYRYIKRIIQRLPPNLPVLATTATANNRVLKDIQEQLSDMRIMRGALARSSLALQAFRLSSQADRLAWLAAYIPSLPGSGIIYTLTQRDCEVVAEWLKQHGIRVEAYHADLKHVSREELEEQLINNKLKVLVSTVALGMGFDKPDLGFVVHYQAPNSLMSYYQQIGRAGRSIDRAVCILFAGEEDANIQEYFRNRVILHPDTVHKVLDVIASNDGITSQKIAENINLHLSKIEYILKQLATESPAPIIHVKGEGWRRTICDFKLDQQRIKSINEVRQIEWEEVQSYIDIQSCRMKYILDRLDDSNTLRCGKCDNCLGEPIVKMHIVQQFSIDALGYLQASEQPIKPRTQLNLSKFQFYSFDRKKDLKAEEGRYLAHWGDSGWGTMIAEGKRTTYFENDLVKAIVEMITQRWKPDPFPTWVTCVPSLNNPTLVPLFAQRVAETLGLPFLNIVHKINQNKPQKMQHNKVFQCKNLDGVFKVEYVQEGPVFLIDDIVDSRWTFTIITALLRDAGSGPVYPLALASSAH